MKVVYFLCALTYYLELCRCTPLPFKTKSSVGILLHEDISTNLHKLLWNSVKPTLPIVSRVLDDAPPLPEEKAGQWLNAEDVDSSLNFNNQNKPEFRRGIETEYFPAESKVRLSESEFSTPKENTEIGGKDTQNLKGMFLKYLNNGNFKVRVEPEEHESSLKTSSEVPITTEFPYPVVNVNYYNSFEAKPTNQEPIFMKRPVEVAAARTILLADDLEAIKSNNQTTSDVSATESDKISDVNSSTSASNSDIVLNMPETSTTSQTPSTVDYVKIEFPGEPQKEISISQYPGKVTEIVELLLPSGQESNINEDNKKEGNEIFNQEFDGQFENPESFSNLETEGSKVAKDNEEYDKPTEEGTEEISNIENKLKVIKTEVAEGVEEEVIKRIDTKNVSDINNKNEIGVEDEIFLDGVSEGVGEDVDATIVENVNETNMMGDVAEQLVNDEAAQSNLKDEEIVKDEDRTTDAEVVETTEETMHKIQEEPIELTLETNTETLENNEERDKKPLKREVQSSLGNENTLSVPKTSDSSKLVSDVRDIINGNYVRTEAEAEISNLDKTSSRIIDHMWKGRTSGEAAYFREAVEILLEKLREEMENSKPFMHEDSHGHSFTFEGLDNYNLKTIDILNIKSRNRKIIEADFIIGPFLVNPSEESSSITPQYQKILGTMEIRIRKQDDGDRTVYLQRLSLKKPESMHSEIAENFEQYINSIELTDDFINPYFKNLLEENIKKILGREDFYYLFSSFYRI